MSDDNKFKSLDELKDSIDMGLDIECFIYGDRYYIGAPKGDLLIALCPDGDGDIYANTDDLLSNHKIKGKPLKDIWQDIEIYSM